MKMSDNCLLTSCIWFCATVPTFLSSCYFKMSKIDFGFLLLMLIFGLQQFNKERAVLKSQVFNCGFGCLWHFIIIYSNVFTWDVACVQPVHTRLQLCLSVLFFLTLCCHRTRHVGQLIIQYFIRRLVLEKNINREKSFLCHIVISGLKYLCLGNTSLLLFWDHKTPL
jgi:hypothetical protein